MSDVTLTIPGLFVTCVFVALVAYGLTGMAATVEAYWHSREEINDSIREGWSRRRYWRVLTLPVLALIGVILWPVVVRSRIRETSEPFKAVAWRREDS